MTRKQAYSVILLILIGFYFSGGSLWASSATVHVRATILPYIQMSVQQHKTDYAIAQIDLDRNYIDLPLSATIKIDTNVPEVMLSLVLAGGDEVLISFSGEDRFDNVLEISLSESERFAQQVTRNLDFRVLFDRDTLPGNLDLAPLITMSGY